MYYFYPTTGYRYYYTCCRDGKPRQNIWNTRKSDKQRGQGNKKPSRKMNRSCISRIYATHNSDDSVHVVYISTHTNHSLAIEDEAKNIPLPKSTQVEISAKLQQGISVERIMEGKDLVDDNSNWETECKQAYKHYKIEQNNFYNIYNTGSDMCATISAMHECVWGGRIGLTATVIGEDIIVNHWIQ